MKPIATLLALLVTMCVSPSSAQTSPDSRPSIRLDKSTFAVGESVFFWVGAGWANGEPIPKEYWNTCRLTVTRPNGTNKVIRLDWPPDALNGSSWIGGYGLGEAAKPGRYSLVMEFAGQKTDPALLVVENIPAVRQIGAEFVFGSPVKSNGVTETPVTLTVRNGTNETIRFPHRDGTNGMVSVSFSQEKPASFTVTFSTRQINCWTEMNQKRLITLLTISPGKMLGKSPQSSLSQVRLTHSSFPCIRLLVK